MESPQGSQSSSRVEACTCAFLPNCSCSVTVPSCGSRDLWLSHEAFPRGFPTGLSHVPPWCESILGLKIEAVQGKQASLEWTETSGGLWKWWHDPGVPLAFPVESASSWMRWQRREFFPDHQGKDQSSRAMRRKQGSSGCGRDSRASSRVESGMSGNFLICSKGVKDPLEVPEVRCA